MPAKKKVKSRTDLRLDAQVLINHDLQKRVSDLENKFFAFQCGAQAQMERDRTAEAEGGDTRGRG